MKHAPDPKPPSMRSAATARTMLRARALRREAGVQVSEAASGSSLALSPNLERPARLDAHDRFQRADGERLVIALATYQASGSGSAALAPDECNRPRALVRVSRAGRSQPTEAVAQPSLTLRFLSQHRNEGPVGTACLKTWTIEVAISAPSVVQVPPPGCGAGWGCEFRTSPEPLRDGVRDGLHCHPLRMRILAAVA